jgi:hypothetical protein
MHISVNMQWTADFIPHIAQQRWDASQHRCMRGNDPMHEAWQHTKNSSLLVGDLLQVVPDKSSGGSLLLHSASTQGLFQSAHVSMHHGYSSQAC